MARNDTQIEMQSLVAEVQRAAVREVAVLPPDVDVDAEADLGRIDGLAVVRIRSNVRVRDTRHETWRSLVDRAHQALENRP
jgi:hypothetical protein